VTAWTSVRLSSVLRDIDDREHPDLEVLSVYRDLGVIPKASRDDNFNKTPEDLSSYKRVRVGDLVINKMKAWSGSLAVSDYDGIVSGDYMVCAVKGSVDRRFLHHLLRSRLVFSQIASLSTGIRPSQWRLYWDDLREVRIDLPPPEVQRVIADYLDAETACLDALVRAKQRQVTLIREHLAVITARTVNAGSYPRAAVRRIFRVVNGSTPPSGVRDYWNGEIVWVTPQDLSGDNMVLAGSTRTLTDDGYAACGTSMVPAGSIVLSTRAAIGSVAIAGTALCTNQGCKALVPAKPVDPWFYYFVFLAAAQELESLGNGSTFRELGSEDLGAMKVPVPPLVVQRELAEELRHAQRSSLQLATGVSRQIELLSERRQALITAAVTGQLVIPGVAA